jgi:hypothetical protein
VVEPDLFGLENNGDSVETDSWGCALGFYEGITDEFVKETSKVLGNDFLGLMVYGRPATPPQMKGRDMDVVIVSDNNAWNQKSKGQLSKIKEYLENNNIYKMKIDALFMPQEVFEDRMKRIAGATVGGKQVEITVDKMASWLTSDYRTKPTISIVPVYEKGEYLTRQIQEASKNPIKERPGSLNEFRI